MFAGENAKGGNGGVVPVLSCGTRIATVCELVERVKIPIVLGMHWTYSKYRESAHCWKWAEIETERQIRAERKIRSFDRHLV